MSLSNPLDESFDSPLGQLGDNFIYSDNTAFSVASQTHRDIRTFEANTNVYRATVGNLSLYNVGYLGGSGTAAHNLTVGQLQSSYVSGHSWASIENWTITSQPITSAPKTFTISGGQVTAKVGPSTSHSYSPALTATFSGSLPTCQFVSPSGTLDILSGLNTPGTEYDVVFTIRGVPPRTATICFALTSKLTFVDIWGQSVDVLFSNFANQFAPLATADATLRFNRNLLNTLDLTRLNDVRLSIVTSGTSGSFTSRFQDLRVIPSGVFTNPIDIVNTQTKRFTANVESSASPQSIFFGTARPKNLTQNIRFNTGTSPAVVSGTNQFTAFYRYSSTNNLPSYLSTGITSSGGMTNFNFYQTISGSTALVSNFSSATLSGSTDYIVRTTLKDNRGQVDLYNVDGAFIGPRVGTTGNKLLPIDQGINKRGLVGFNFNPLNYDFQLAGFTMQRAEFGTMTTSPALSFKPIKAVQLFTNTSGPSTLMDSTNITAYGDATLTINSHSGDPAPDYLISRAGTTTNVTPTSNWSGGIVSSGTYQIHDPNELYLAGSIYPYTLGSATSTTYSGTFQVGLLSKDNQVGYITTLPNIVGGQWNNFVIPLNPNVVSGKYYIILRNIGYYPQQFEVDNISLYHNTISWAGANDGENFNPFYDNINNQYALLSFPGQHPQIQLRAAALSDTNAWIESWVDKPIYQE